MIKILKKIFHTDKWWGKTIFIILTYIVFWCIFYGSSFLLPVRLEGSNSLDLYFLILVPLISFVIPGFLKKIFGTRKIYLYLIHILLLPILWYVFYVLTVFRSLSYSGFGLF